MNASEAHRFRYAEAASAPPKHVDRGTFQYPKRYETTPTYRHLLSTSFEPHNPIRVIAHCDVDAAYAQFEAARLGLNCAKVPIGVLQWTSLIAVNYVARAYGVNRFNCTLEQAKERCPELHLIHVASYGPGDETPQYYDNPSSKTHKISLDLYRRESKKIMEIFQCQLDHNSIMDDHVGFDLAPVSASCWMPKVPKLLENSVDVDILFEKASIDESFFDLSVYVRKQLLRRFPFLSIQKELDRLPPEARAAKLDTPLPPLPLAVKQELVKKSWSLLGAWWPADDDNVSSSQQASQSTDDDEALPELGWLDVAHAIAAERMVAVRKHVHQRLGYTTSAGIAENKALAKLCSSFRKPCSQTVLLPRFVFDFLGPLSFRKIRFLGGKFGAEVADLWGEATVGELWLVPMEEMLSRFGDGGRWLYHLFRGLDYSEVNHRAANRSMMSAKNFQPHLTSQAKGLHWLSIMSAELSARLQEEREECPLLYPRSLVLRYLVAGTTSARSQQMPFGYIRNEDLAKEIYARAEKLWNQSIGPRLEQAVGLNRIGICTLSLSFAGLERQSRDQKQLHAFFEMSKRKCPPDEADSPSEHSSKTRSKKHHILSPNTPKDQPSERAKPAYETSFDQDTQTETARWQCSQCDHVITVPIFDESDDELASLQQRSYEVLLDRLQLEHSHWHLAMNLAADP